MTQAVIVAVRRYIIAGTGDQQVVGSRTNGRVDNGAGIVVRLIESDGRTTQVLQLDLDVKVGAAPA